MTRSGNPYLELPEVPQFTLRSDDIADGQTLPVAQRSAIFGAPGNDRSPHLTWDGFPDETRSFAVTCYDADAPTVSGFWHWVVFNIPVDVTELEAGAGALGGDRLPAGAVTLANDAGTRQYLGGSPPPGHGPHRYFFAVHALDTDDLAIGADVTPAWLGFNLFGHTVGRGILTPVLETAE